MSSSAGEDLKALINSWSAENPEARTSAFLSRKSGIDYNTVRRCTAGGNPDCQTAQGILPVVCSKEQGLAYLREHFPHAAKFHEQEFTSLPVFSDAESIKPIMDDLLSFLIMNLSYGGHAAKAYIQKSFGEMGMEAAHGLVNSGRLRWSGESLVPTGTEKFFSYASKEDVVKACQHILTLSRGSNGYPISMIGSLSHAEHEKAKMLLREFCSAIKELICSSQGGPYMMGLASIYVSLFSGEEK